jgi:hypothetical protein
VQVLGLDVCLVEGIFNTVVEFALRAVLVSVDFLVDGLLQMIFVVRFIEVYKRKLVKLVSQVITLPSSF